MSMLTPDETRELLPPRAMAKAEYDKHGPARGNLRHGYVVRG